VDEYVKQGCIAAGSSQELSHMVLGDGKGFSIHGILLGKSSVIVIIAHLPSGYNGFCGRKRGEKPRYFLADHWILGLEARQNASFPSAKRRGKSCVII
jgi:hypothetical protein